MKSIHRKMTPLLRKQLKVQAERIKQCGVEIRLNYFHPLTLESGTFYSTRFKSEIIMPYVQQYLITGDGFEPATTEWFDPENHFDADLNMVVYDLHNSKYTTNGKDWKTFQTDHL